MYLINLNHITLYKDDCTSLDWCVMIIQVIDVIILKSLPLCLPLFPITSVLNMGCRLVD